MRNKKIIIVIIILIICLLVYYLINGNKISISSISLKEHSITMVVGNHMKLDINVLPYEASDKDIVWESDNTNIVSVNNGIITANNVGEAIIIVKSKDNKISDQCTIKVLNKEADQLELLEHNLEIRINETKELHLTIIPNDLISLVNWNSSDSNIVKVDSNGVITGISSGNAVIKASYGNKEEICNIKVVLPVNSISIEESITINVNETQKLNLVIDPISSANQDIDWTNSNEEVATIKNGIITGLKEGTTTITASIDGKSALCNVTVIVPVEEIKLNKTNISLKKGNIDLITATIIPSNATNKNITWTSSNPSIVTVDNGRVTSVGTGIVTITATIDGKEASAKVVSTGYVITEDSKFASLENIATYNSDTLRYRVTNDDGNFVLVWVMDANKQWNSALPKLGTVYKAEELLSKEINQYNYQNKGLVATNASFFWDGWGDYPCTPFIMNKGNIILDIENKNYNKKVYSVLGMTKEGVFKHYHFNENTYTMNMKSRQTMIDDGVRNSFTFSGTVINPNGGISSSNRKNNLTIICQVDENNFVIYSGSRLTVFQAGKKLKNTFNCRAAYNLDGGGSRKLYYKTNTMLEPVKVFGGNRAIPDMMYFVEQ